MKLRNFSLGINSYPASTPGSNHTTARDVLNLRVDGDGYLRLAPGLERWQEFSSKVTGVAKAHDHLFILLEDGDLWVVTRASPDQPRRVGSTEMRGRLSIIDEFETFFLLTSEGADDPGYYFAVRMEDESGGSAGDLYPLKYEQTPKPQTFRITDRVEEDGPGHENSYKFFYLFAEVNVNDDVPEGSPASAFHAPVSEPILQGRIDSDEDKNWRAFFDDIEFANPDTTHIYIYRSPQITRDDEDYVPELTPGDAFNIFDKNAFFRVGQVLRGTRTWADNNVGLGRIPLEDEDEEEIPIRQEERDSLASAHILSGIPENTRSWKHFNGYNFVANGARLRFSEVDFGVLKHSVFPETNSINAPGDTHFVESFDETLVFGDASHFHVLRGYDPSNFQVYQVASVGPVSGYAHAVLPSAGFGFIGAKGFHFFDGGQIKEISSPQLDRFFEGRRAVDGAVLPLPNSESLWSVEFDDLTRYTFLLNTERLDAPVWTRLSLFFDQGTAFPLAPLGRWVFTDDGEWVFDDDIPWGFTDPDAQAFQRIFLARDVALVEEYLWHDLDSGVRESLNWIWESNLMRGGSETVKVYDRLKLAGYAENDINVDFNLDIEGETVEKNIRNASFAKNSRKKRIPIKRRANGITFHISGYGDVLLREVELDSRVVGRV